MRLILLLFSCMFLGACATPMVNGAGEVYHLTLNNVIYRDLTLPISLHNSQVIERIDKYEPPKIEPRQVKPLSRR